MKAASRPLTARCQIELELITSLWIPATPPSYVCTKSRIFFSECGNPETGWLKTETVCLWAIKGFVSCSPRRFDTAQAAGNVQRALTLAALVDNYLHTESQALIEPDTVALQNIFTTGNEKLTKEILEQTRMHGKTLRIEDAVAQEIPAGGKELRMALSPSGQ